MTLGSKGGALNRVYLKVGSIDARLQSRPTVLVRSPPGSMLSCKDGLSACSQTMPNHTTLIKELTEG